MNEDDEPIEFIPVRNAQGEIGFIDPWDYNNIVLPKNLDYCLTDDEIEKLRQHLEQLS